MNLRCRLITRFEKFPVNCFQSDIGGGGGGSNGTELELPMDSTESECVGDGAEGVLDDPDRELSELFRAGLSKSPRSKKLKEVLSRCPRFSLLCILLH